MSGSRSGADGPTRRVVPPSVESEGDLAVRMMAGLGVVLDDWQAAILEDWLSVAEDGKLAALTAGLSVPRQQGKSMVMAAREIYGAVARGEKILSTAHHLRTTRKHLKLLLSFFGNEPGDSGARFPELNAMVREVRQANGQEGIFLDNGGSIEFIARSKSSGRGFTADVLCLDEAQELSDDALEALLSTTSSAPLGDPQWIVVGTPPGPNAEGAVFSRIRGEAWSDDPGRLSWHEWSPGNVPLADIRLDDRGLWRATNPALGSGRLQMSVAEGERRRFSDAGFARERLGWWGEGTQGKALVPGPVWADLAASAAPDGVRAYAVRFSFDGARVAVAVAVRPEGDGPVHVEVVGIHDVGAGTSELVSWIVDRWRDSAGVVVEGKSGAGDFVNALLRARVPRHVVTVPGTDQVIAANAGFLNAAYEGRLSHFAQEGLDESVRVAGRRRIGSAGGWGWRSLRPDGDVLPVESVALAHWLATTSKRKRGGGSGRSRSGGRRAVVA